MVPGMTERKRRAADLQRLEWLADAVLGSAKVSAGPVVPPGSRYSLPSVLVRQGMATGVVSQTHRFHLIWPGRKTPLLRRATNRLIA